MKENKKDSTSVSSSLTEKSDSHKFPDDTKSRQNPAPDQKEDDKPEKEIDIFEIIYKLWANRRQLIAWSLWGFVAGLVIAFSIPKHYTTKVDLAPEEIDASAMGGLGALASMAGVNMQVGTDAIYPLLYPDIVESVPFATSLFNVPVTDKEGNTYLLKDYLIHKNKSPWWVYVMRSPGLLIELFKTKTPDSHSPGDGTNNFHLTKTEEILVKTLRGLITADVDQKTSVISITVTMQDPVISATMADTVVARLSSFITDYRTNKARKDLEYAELLNREAQEDYYKAQQNLADYIDRNQNLATKSAQVTRDRLENEATLAFNLYNATAMQVQQAKSKVQETTPVYTAISPPTVPSKASKPKKLLIIFAFIFLGFVSCAAWILFGKPAVTQYKEKAAQLKAETPEASEKPAKKKRKFRIFPKKEPEQD